MDEIDVMYSEMDAVQESIQQSIRLDTRVRALSTLLMRYAIREAAAIRMRSPGEARLPKGFDFAVSLALNGQVRVYNHLERLIGTDKAEEIYRMVERFISQRGYLRDQEELYRRALINMPDDRYVRMRWEKAILDLEMPAWQH